MRKELKKHVPRTILAIDEAQILIPARANSTARKAIESFVLEGRNYGLSLWLATQRPKGAISEAAASQIDTFIIHRLSVSDDISAVCGLLQNAEPSVMRFGGRELTLPDLICSLDVGQAIFSSATSDASRFVVGNVRPRNVAHGGEAFFMRRLPWTKFQDFYLRLGFLKVLVAVLSPQRRSEMNDSIIRKLASPTFDPAWKYPALWSWVAHTSDRQNSCSPTSSRETIQRRSSQRWLTP